ncbi:MAG: N-acetyl-gamma-glutamyl-phosphate reductase [Ferruginibacter sp.]|nr:N-acetyl-gamma-glutamyl-phosphate reductase [Ferruginibacter sp.]
MSIKINIGIIGGAGYTAGELIRLLMHHSNANIVFVHSKSNTGKPLHTIHNDLIGDTDIIFTNNIVKDVDLIFLCVGYTEARKFLQENEILNTTKIIDLSHDFRLYEHNNFGERKFIYGLPELNKEEIKVANNIANPGCFATCIQLGLLPLAKEKLLSTIHTTGITGSTGAGQSMQATSHFSWRVNNIQAYKTLTHQHVDEIKQSLQQLQGNEASLHFVPWRGDFARGIFVTSYCQSNVSLDEANELYKSYYATHPFVHISNVMIDLKQVVNTNKAVIYIEKIDDQLVIHSAIDNLLKGASGQALQNMNLMFGLEETKGLKLKAVKF